MEKTITVFQYLQRFRVFDSFYRIALSRVSCQIPQQTYSVQLFTHRSTDILMKGIGIEKTVNRLIKGHLKIGVIFIQPKQRHLQGRAAKYRRITWSGKGMSFRLFNFLVYLRKLVC